MLSKMKKVCGYGLILAVVVVPFTAQAATTKYESTYSMTVGLVSSNHPVTAPGTWKTETSGLVGHSGVDISVYLNKDVFGLDPTISTNNHPSIGFGSSSTNITTSHGSGDYYVQLINNQGQLESGDITFTINDAR